MEQAVAVTTKDGEIICVGLGATSDMYEYAHAALVAQEKVFRGTEMGSSVPERDIPRYAQMYMDGMLKLDCLKSGTMSFDELNLNLDLLDRATCCARFCCPRPQTLASSLMWVPILSPLREHLRRQAEHAAQTFEGGRKHAA